MRRSKFSESQIVAILQDGRCRAAGRRDLATVWHQLVDLLQVESQMRGPGGLHLKRLRELEQENSRLKRLYAELSIENAALKGSHPKKALTAVERREAVTHLVTQGGLAVQRACRAIGLGPAISYRPGTNSDTDKHCKAP